MIRVGNAQAFWGDRSQAAAELLSQQPDLDFLTMDYLAEVSMSILAQQRSRNDQMGYPRDFLQVIENLCEYWASGGRCRLIANAGGLNPLACALACQQRLNQLGCRELKIGVVSGDDVVKILCNQPKQSMAFANLDDHRPLDEVIDRLITANAYMGCQGIVAALQQGADIVITGRVADPSMVLAACVFSFDWPLDDWDRLAQGTVAGHLIECGTQVTGGILTDWLHVADPAHLGFPIVEIEKSGRFVLTKALGTGGVVSEQTVKEQLVYEIGDPANYISPDVQVSLLELQIRTLSQDRVEVIGATGKPKPSMLKVSATYADGHRAAGTLTIVGDRATEKAHRSAEVVLQRLTEAGWVYRQQVVECLGGDSHRLNDSDAAAPSVQGFETVLRIAVESDSQAAVEAFSKEMIPLVTAGCQGTTGYAEGRPKVHQLFRYWPCLIERESVRAQVQLLECPNTLATRQTQPRWPLLSASTRSQAVGGEILSSQLASLTEMASQSGSSAVSSSRRLIDVAYGRSGDKGIHANIGILARVPADYIWLVEWLTAERVESYFHGWQISSVKRYEMANLHGLNFILFGALKQSGRNDAQGKTLAQRLLLMPIG